MPMEKWKAAGEGHRPLVRCAANVISASGVATVLRDAGRDRGNRGASSGARTRRRRQRQPIRAETTEAAATVTMYHPEWGQSKWSGQLRKTHWQGHPDEFWTSGPSAHAATFRPGSRQCTPREAMSASERLYRNEKRYSRRSGRYRSATPAGCDPYARRAAQNDGRRRGAQSSTGFKAPEFRNRPKSASAARRKKREEMKEAVNITRRPSSAGSSRPVTPVIGKPLLNAQKMRDYGYGIPRWSPYAPTGYRVSKGTGNQDYGEYTKHDYLKRLSDLLAEHGRKSGADLKMLLDPSMKSLMERRNKEGV